MAGSFASEFFKLRKRPAVWVVGLILVFAVVVFGYVISYQIVLGQRAIGAEGGDGSPTAEEALMPTLLPESVLSNVLLVFSGGGGAVALVLGALAAGSEYGWGTLKTLLARPPGRLRTLFGKVLAVDAVLFVLAFLMLAAGALSSYTIAVLEGMPARWPPPLDWAAALGAAGLILAAYASLGIFFAVLFRSASLAIGAGLGYALVFEIFISQFQGTNDALRGFQNALLGRASADLAGAFASSGQPFSDPVRDALILGVYGLLPVLLAALVFRQRDIT